MTPQWVAFRVNGMPGAQGSKRHVGHGIMIESSKKVKPWRQDVKTAAEYIINKAVSGYEPDYPVAGPVAVDIAFRFARPKSHYRTGRNAHLLRDDAPTHPISRHLGDADKLARSTLDALVAAGMLADDSLVAHLSVTKEWCTKGSAVGASVTVRLLRKESSDG